MVSIKAIRNRAWNYLSPATAAAAGMSLADLQQFCGYHYWPDESQLRELARAMKFEPEQIR